MATLHGSFARLDIADGLRCEIDGDTVRVLAAPAVPAVQRADLAADNARLERGIADVTRERDDAHRLALDGAERRQRLISELSVAERRCAALTAEADGLARELADLRAAVIAAAGGVAPDVSGYGHHVGLALRSAAQLDREAAHRAAGESVDLRVWVRVSTVTAICAEQVARINRELLRTTDPIERAKLCASRGSIRWIALYASPAGTCRKAQVATGVFLGGADVEGIGPVRGADERDLRSEAVEGGEQEAVEGTGGHGASVATADSDRKAHVG